MKLGTFLVSFFLCDIIIATLIFGFIDITAINHATSFLNNDKLVEAAARSLLP